jgi:hypothetical protein
MFMAQYTEQWNADDRPGADLLTQRLDIHEKNRRDVAWLA